MDLKLEKIRFLVAFRRERKLINYSCLQNKHPNTLQVLNSIAKSIYRLVLAVRKRGEKNFKLTIEKSIFGTKPKFLLEKAKKLFLLPGKFIKKKKQHYFEV